MCIYKVIYTHINTFIYILLYLYRLYIYIYIQSRAQFNSAAQFNLAIQFNCRLRTAQSRSLAPLRRCAADSPSQLNRRGGSRRRIELSRRIGQNPRIKLKRISIRKKRKGIRGLNSIRPHCSIWRFNSIVDSAPHDLVALRRRAATLRTRNCIVELDRVVELS